MQQIITQKEIVGGFMKSLFVAMAAMFALAACDGKGERSKWVTDADQEPLSETLADRVVAGFENKNGTATVRLNMAMIAYDTLESKLFKDGDVFSLSILRCVGYPKECASLFDFNFQIIKRTVDGVPTVTLEVTKAESHDWDIRFTALPNISGFLTGYSLPADSLTADYEVAYKGVTQRKSLARPLTPPARARVQTPVSREGIAQAIINTCDMLDFSDAKVDCKLRFRDKQIDKDAFNVCFQEIATKDKIACFDKMEGKEFASGVVGICDQFPGGAEKLQCLTTLAGGKIEDFYVKSCDKEARPADKVSCIKRMMR